MAAMKRIKKIRGLIVSRYLNLAVFFCRGFDIEQPPGGRLFFALCGRRGGIC
jgi:hypothetical protein